MKKSIKYGTIIGTAVLLTIFIPVILFIYFFIGFGSYDKFSAKYDKDVFKYILKHKTFLGNSNHDTIFVVDYDYHECSMDPRTFIDKKYSRPFIQSELKSLGYKDILFVSSDNGVSINGGQDININKPVIDNNKPCYTLHLWTQMFGTGISKYSIDILETYYNNDTLRTYKYHHVFSCDAYEQCDSTFEIESMTKNND